MKDGLCVEINCDSCAMSQVHTFAKEDFCASHAVRIMCKMSWGHTICSRASWHWESLTQFCLCDSQNTETICSPMSAMLCGISVQSIPILASIAHAKAMNSSRPATRAVRIGFSPALNGVHGQVQVLQVTTHQELEKLADSHFQRVQDHFGILR
ncbi:hypothetical protein ABBQ32_004694 [Trebouxia sp. C0010 RCD-2024]